MTLQGVIERGEAEISQFGQLLGSVNYADFRALENYTSLLPELDILLSEVKSWMAEIVTELLELLDSVKALLQNLDEALDQLDLLQRFILLNTQSIAEISGTVRQLSELLTPQLFDFSPFAGIAAGTEQVNHYLNEQFAALPEGSTLDSFLQDLSALQGQLLQLQSQLQP